MEKFDRNFVIELKTVILQSRFQAARSANKEQLLLYMYIGARIEHEAKSKAWGSKVLQSISKQLQAELQGLRGFSPENLKKMRIFASFWFSSFFQNSIGSAPSNQLINFNEHAPNYYNTFVVNAPLVIGSAMPNQLPETIADTFFAVSFTHHYCIASNCETKEEALFYLHKTAVEFWNYRHLEKPMGVATFITSNELPEKYKGILPDPKSLKNLLGK